MRKLNQMQSHPPDVFSIHHFKFISVKNKYKKKSSETKAQKYC